MAMNLKKISDTKVDVNNVKNDIVEAFKNKGLEQEGINLNNLTEDSLYNLLENGESLRISYSESSLTEDDLWDKVSDILIKVKAGRKTIKIECEGMNYDNSVDFSVYI